MVIQERIFKKEKMNREKTVIIILISICIILWFINEDQSSQLYTETVQNVNIDQKAHGLHLQNQSLRNELLYKSSYQYIWVHAHAQGYISAPFITP